MKKNLEEELKNLVKEECSQSGHVGNLSDDKISKIIQMSFALITKRNLQSVSYSFR